MKIWTMLIAIFWASCASPEISQCEKEVKIDGERACLDAPCWSTSLADCEKKGCQLLVAQPYLENESRFGPSEGVGCQPSNLGHQNAITYAEDSKGKCWQFPSTTIPYNWTSELNWSYKREHPSGCNDDLYGTNR